MKVSIIIPTYKDNVALKLILDALSYQTYSDFEIVVVEDNDSNETKEFLQNYKIDKKILHFTQEDKGNRKAKIINKALPHVTGEYIVFIDGDVIPYSTFIQNHLRLAEKKTILCGRRVNLGDAVSQDLRKEKTTALELEKKYFRKFSYINSGNTRHYEQGIVLCQIDFLSDLIQNSDKNVHILGSNFSCFREDLFAINGFDEDIAGCSKDDVDLEWRFLMNNCRLKSAKFCANLFHLNHGRSIRTGDEEIAKKEMAYNKENKKFVCSNGINKRVEDA